MAVSSGSTRGTEEATVKRATRRSPCANDLIGFDASYLAPPGDERSFDNYKTYNNTHKILYSNYIIISVEE